MERSSQMMAQVVAQVGHMVECDFYPEARYDLVAEALGCYGEMVEQIEDLRPALERAAESGRPALIQVMVDQTLNMGPPGAMEFGLMVYRSED